MKIVFDAAKRSAIFAERGLDVADAASIFEGFHLTRDDAKHSETERRYITVGNMGDETVLLVWTRRGVERRVITMWKANERERELLRRERERRH